MFSFAIFVLMTQTVVVIGAGPAGLTAAYFLLKNNIRTQVIEGSKDIGGLAGAIKLWGKSYDIGPHTFLESSQPAAVNFWKEIGGADLQNIPLNRGMILKKQNMDFPPTAAGLIRSVGIISFARSAVGLLRAKLWNGNGILHSGDLFRKKYGNYFRQLTFNPFCEKYMGLPDSQVDLAFAAGLTSFVKDSEKPDVKPEKHLLKKLLYPKQGTKIMWSRIAENINEQNPIIFEKRLTRVVTENKTIIRLEFNDGTEMKTDFLVSTLPVATFIKLIDSCPAHIPEEAKKLVSRNTVLVYLRMKKPAFRYQYVTVFDHSLEAGRITNFNSWKEDNSESETVLCVEYWCSTSDVNWTCAKDEMASKAIHELHLSGVINQGDVLDSEVLRLPNSHPVLNKGYVSTLSKINTYLAEFKNLALAGRHATFAWDGQADNIVAGMKLAEKIKETIIGY